MHRPVVGGGKERKEVLLQNPGGGSSREALWECNRGGINSIQCITKKLVMLASSRILVYKYLSLDAPNHSKRGTTPVVLVSNEKTKNLYPNTNAFNLCRKINKSVSNKTVKQADVPDEPSFTIGDHTINRQTQLAEEGVELGTHQRAQIK